MDSYTERGLGEVGITFEKGYDYGRYTASKESQLIITQKDNTITQLLERLNEINRQLAHENYHTTNIQDQLREVTAELHEEQSERQLLQTENQTLIADLADTAFENRDQRFKIDELECNLSKFTHIDSLWGCRAMGASKETWNFDTHHVGYIDHNDVFKYAEFDIDYENNHIYVSSTQTRIKGRHPTRPGSWYIYGFPPLIDDGIRTLTKSGGGKQYFFTERQFQLFKFNLYQ